MSGAHVRRQAVLLALYEHADEPEPRGRAGLAELVDYCACGSGEMVYAGTPCALCRAEPGRRIA